MSKEIEQVFVNKGYTWRFKNSGSPRTPTATEIDETIQHLKKSLEDQEDNSQAEAGRLIVQKRGGNFHVYVLMSSEVAGG